MCLIDRYLFGLFLKIFLISLVSFTGAYVLGDFVNNLNDFVDLADAGGGLIRALVGYYAIRGPWLFDLVGRILALVSAVFVAHWLVRYNELTALMAAGIPRWRVIRPLVVGACLVSLAGIVNREWIIPAQGARLAQNARDLVRGNASPLQPQYDTSTSILVNGQQVKAGEQTIVRPSFRLPLGMSPQGSLVTAQIARFTPATQDHPAGYLLLNVDPPFNDPQMASIRGNGQLVVYLPGDTDWLQPGRCFIVSQVPIDQLVGSASLGYYASTWSLIRELRRWDREHRADLRVEVHSRMVQPVLDVAFFCAGLPVVMVRAHRGIFVAAGSCLLVVTLFVTLVTTCHTLGANHVLSPALAAWLPLMVLVPAACFASSSFER